jgi:TIR domain
MKVFISWSGKTSCTAAHALKDWLPLVIQAAKPFVSNQDITAGDRWPCTLARELEETNFGVVCVTPFNLNAPWLNFESGSLSKAIDQSCVVPLLFGVDPGAVHGPLSQFQSIRFNEEGMLALLVSLNARLPAESQLSENFLRKKFKILWPKLSHELRNLGHALNDETETGYPWFFTAKDLEKREFDPSTSSP